MFGDSLGWQVGGRIVAVNLDVGRLGRAPDLPPIFGGRLVLARLDVDAVDLQKRVAADRHAGDLDQPTLVEADCVRALAVAHHLGNLDAVAERVDQLAGVEIDDPRGSIEHRQPALVGVQGQPRRSIGVHVRVAQPVGQRRHPVVRRIALGVGELERLQPVEQGRALEDRNVEVKAVLDRRALVFVVAVFVLVFVLVAVERAEQVLAQQLAGAWIVDADPQLAVAAVGDHAAVGVQEHAGRVGGAQAQRQRLAIGIVRVERVEPHLAGDIVDADELAVGRADDGDYRADVGDLRERPTIAHCGCTSSIPNASIRARRSAGITTALP